MTNRAYKWDYAGIQKIEIPITPDMVTPEVVTEYWGEIINKNKSNSKKIEYMLNFTNGIQDIYVKSRKFDSENNNKVVENHDNVMVNLKKGFLLGDKREFAKKSDINSDDLIYLDRFLADVSFHTKDLAVKHNIYATGIGTDFVLPRTDIFEDVGENAARYKSVDEGYNVEFDAPFVYECVDSRNNFVVYSSALGVAGIKDLFCVNISQINVKGIKQTIYTVYAREWAAQFDGSGTLMAGTLKETPIGFKTLPMTEHSINETRMGVVEMTLDLLNTVNTTVSSSLDNIVDVVNQILVFLNCEIDSEQIAAMYEQGAICIPDTGGTNKATLDKITVDLKHSDINVFFEQVLTRCYDIAGVPLASASGIGNGNNGAAYIGGGWTNAHTIIKRDIVALEQSDRELLRKMLAICKQNSSNPVNEINANQVEIKYNVNMSNDLLSKTQALQNLVDANIDYEDIVKVVGLWGDAKTVAKRWRENVESLKKQTERAMQQNVAEQPTEQVVEQTVGIEPNLDKKSIEGANNAE